MVEFVFSYFLGFGFSMLAGNGPVVAAGPFSENDNYIFPLCVPNEDRNSFTTSKQKALRQQLVISCADLLVKV